MRIALVDCLYMSLYLWQLARSLFFNFSCLYNLLGRIKQLITSIIMGIFLQYSKFLTSFLCLHPSLFLAARLSAT